MKSLLEAEKIIPAQCKLIKDCSFDQLYLVGKPYPKNKKVVTYLGNAKFIPSFLNYDISGVICTEDIAEELACQFDGGVLVTNEPKTAFFEINNYYAEYEKEEVPNCIAQSAVIHPSAIIEDCNVQIGENTVIMANAVVKSGSKIGNGCVIHENCVIGSPAFYYYMAGDVKKSVISTGTVTIEDNVELHTSVTVEKGVMGGSTRIGYNTKIDNLCLIGHDSQLGIDVTIAAGSTLAGGVVLKDGCFLGVGVTVAPNVVCGVNAFFSSGSVVTKDVDDNTHESGNFAIPHDKFVKHIKMISE